jgi:hypothetical protein
MTPENVPPHVSDRYRSVVVCGRRISRLGEETISSFRLSPEIAWTLGTNNLGVFIGATGSLDPIIEKLQRLESSSLSARWIVIAATKKMAAVFVQRWIAFPRRRRVGVTTLKLPKSRGNVTLATPESLKNIATDSLQNVAGVILVDMLCHVHCAREMPNSGAFVVANDRPQMIANFRNSLSIDGWAPPLIILTQKPARSVSTENVARAYCLEGLWFIDGQSFGIRCETAEVNDRTDEERQVGDPGSPNTHRECI